jgi:manganese efflux pump family protein
VNELAFLDIVLYAIVLSVDATAVNITNGVCYRKFTHKRLAWAATLFGVFQGIMPLIGYFLYAFFAEKSDWFISSGKWIAFSLLIFVGGKMIFEGLKAILKPESCPLVDDISNKHIFLQGLATSLDALAVGVSIYVAHDNTNIFWASLIIAVVTFALSFVGGLFGKIIGPFVKKIAPLIGGIVLIIIGISILKG